MSMRKQCIHLARRPPLASRFACRRSLATAAPQEVNIIEVGPRDGLQNEKNTIPLDTKIDLIKRLARTGARTIEAGSFVSPKWTPQMANSSEILDHILRKPPDSPDPIVYQFLVPNAKGATNLMSVYEAFHKGSAASHTPGAPPTPPPSPSMEQSPALNTSSQDPNAMPSGDPVETVTRNSSSNSSVSEIEFSIFTAATETFTHKNTNCSIAESLERFKPVFQMAKNANLRVRAYISVALGCPYEGPDVDPHKVAELAVNLLEMGADEISVADTTGMGTVPKTTRLLKTLTAAGVDNNDLALHFHDTYGMALVNAVVGLEHGVRTFDSAVAGLGGCPYSPGATGNVATEELVHLFHSLGANTGVDVEELAKVGEWISKELGRPNESRVGKAVLSKLKSSR